MKNIFVLSVLASLTACSTLTPIEVARLRIDDTMKDNQHRFFKCYEEQYNENDKKAEGTVQLAFNVEIDGSVSRSSVKSTTLNNPVVEHCMLKVLNDLSFDHDLDEQPIPIVYPFKFAK